MSSSYTYGLGSTSSVDCCAIMGVAPYGNMEIMKDSASTFPEEYRRALV